MNIDRILGVGAVLLAIPVVAASWGYGVGSPKSPGAGFWPLLIALTMAGLGPTATLALLLPITIGMDMVTALIMSHTGNPLYLFSRPLSATLLTLAILVLLYPLVRWAWRLAMGRVSVSGMSG